MSVKDIKGNSNMIYMDGNIPSGFKASKFVGMDSSIANSFPTTKIDLSNTLYTN